MKYFSIDGKIGRLEFALTTIGLAILSMLISACCDTSYYDPYSHTVVEMPLEPLTAIIVVALCLFLVYWEIVTFCKRLNDIPRSRWMVLWSFVPLANLVLWFYLCFKPGAQGSVEATVRQPLPENPEIQTHTFEDKFKSDAAFEPKSTNSEFDRMVADLERLGEMHQKGLLTDDEFQTLKNKLLNK